MGSHLRNGILTVACCFALISSGKVLGQAPDSLSFQGVLTNTSGVAVPDGNYNLLFKMYKGPSKVWEQSQLSTPVKSGVFSVILSGSVTWPLDTVAFNEPIDLGITVNSGTELTPRTSLTSAAYALGIRGMYAVWSDNGLYSAPNLIGGASNNYVANNVVGATISGGGGWDGSRSRADSVLGAWSTVGGGAGNFASDFGATVGGGINNKATGSASTIGGGTENKTTHTGSTVGGGTTNKAHTGSTVGGGKSNTASGKRSTVGGGEGNQTSSDNSTVGGGYYNEASGSASTVGGGDSNTASGKGSTVPGGVNNSATKGYTFAAGQNAKANHSGTFVWADSASASGVDFTSTGVNQFLIRAKGGVGIGTDSPASELHVSGGTGDAQIVLEADTDNFGESDNPLMTMTQDGGTVGVNIGLDESGFGTNTFGIGRRYNSVDFFDTFVIQTGDGDIGIGTNNPGNHRLQVINNRSTGIPGATIYAENSGTGNGIAGMFVSNGTDATLVVDNNSTGDLIKAFSSGLRFAVRNNGDVALDGTVITPATDLAEVFEVEGSSYDYEPGDVLVISIQTNRVVTRSHQPYSTKVVGVYATKPGIQLGTPIDGLTVPMGVIGVLPTKVSTENGPIRRGDLLVTSSTPAHAMRAKPLEINGIEIYPTGTILGKALESFEGPGNGVIEVMVNTQ